MTLPHHFIAYTQPLLGQERWQCFLQAADQEVVSVRLNTAKTGASPAFWPTAASVQQVPWCTEGFYLTARPAFTFDPLLHAGCYYVQEAASMFVAHVLRQWVDRPVSALDLCAAPGGKSSAAIAALPAGSTLVSNEPLLPRAVALQENMTKWGYRGCTVTNRYPRDFVKGRTRFDVTLCDVPCSGEGMFRKDPKAIAEWSPQRVEQCQRLQRDIVADAWQCLAPGGLLLYSTCTINTRENEEVVAWACQQFGAEVLPVEVGTDWGIAGSLLQGFSQPVFRFLPGLTQSEGLFVALLRKPGTPAPDARATKRTEAFVVANRMRADFEPAIAQVLATDYQQGSIPEAAADYATAISYLRGEVQRLQPEVPRGLVAISYNGHPLGVVKNIGSRANNLHPKEWRIKSTHLPTAAPRIF